MNPEDLVDSLLAGSSPTKNSIAKNEPLARAISHFLKLRREGKTDVTLHWFYQHKLQRTYGGPKAMNSVYNYVRLVLNLDPSTGEPLV